MPFSDNLSKENFGRGKVGNRVGWDGITLHGEGIVFSFLVHLLNNSISNCTILLLAQETHDAQNEDAHCTREASRRPISLTAHTRNYFKG